mgnify:CR=1 FL=1
MYEVINSFIQYTSYFTKYEEHVNPKRTNVENSKFLSDNGSDIFKDFLKNFNIDKEKIDVLLAELEE